MVSTADQWRRNRKEEQLTLPSGTVISIRKPNLRAMIMDNIVPQDLIRKVIDLKGKSLQPESAEELDRILKAEMRLREFSFSLVSSPRIILSGEPKENEILASEIPIEDEQFISMWVLGLERAEKVQPFLTERPGGDPGPSVPTIQSEAVNSSGA